MNEIKKCHIIFIEYMNNATKNKENKKITIPRIHIQRTEKPSKKDKKKRRGKRLGKGKTKV